MIDSLVESTLRISTPLIFAAIGGLYSERSGIINIALEGKMLAGAFAAAATTYYCHSPWLGAGAGAAASIALAALYGLSVITFRADQIVAGTAVNMLAWGLTPQLCKVFFDVTGSTPGLPQSERLTSAPMWMAWSLVIFTAWYMKKTRGGLWLRFAGEEPDALDASGVSVNGVRWSALLLCGACAGLGGAVLSICLSSSFSREMTAGRGFIALAALIFGRWNPIRTSLACLLFSFAEAVQIRVQGVSLWAGKSIPVQFIQMLPYVLTLLVLAGFVGKSRAPRNLGKVFIRKGR